MVGQKRKYDEDDKKKHKVYYQKHKEEIKEKNKKYRERIKKDNEKPFSYDKNPNTKKAKMLKVKIEKINKKIEKFRGYQND